MTTSVKETRIEELKAAYDAAGERLAMDLDVCLGGHTKRARGVFRGTLPLVRQRALHTRWP